MSVDAEAGPPLAPDASRRREAIASDQILRSDNTESYGLISYQAAGGARAGVVVSARIFDLAAATGNPGDSALVGFYANWEAAPARLAAALAAGPKTAAMPLAQTKLLAPLLYSGGIYCAGANYQDHAAEMNARQGRPPDPDPHTLGLKPWHFIKASRSVTHPDATVMLPRASMSVDWEVELAAVIGRPAKDGRRVTRARLRHRLSPFLLIE
jgi:2-keto-4-pentenoate hydratase/2-oxohepta-3-ene-1,7-dioic acid hydratase in catechol pathway